MNVSSEYTDLMRYLRKVVLLSERVGERVAQREIGVGRAAYLILRTISEAKTPPSQQELAAGLSLTKGAVSRQITPLQKNGFLKVEGSPRSHRENALGLTRKGRELVQSGYAVQERRERLLYECLRTRDVAATVRVLRAICKRLEEEDKK
jgi:DNA-binding MarR family transcriptional regulator